jgi:TPP-dependent pyruvate/acetoin dehydrogenase alpha subunit
MKRSDVGTPDADTQIEMFRRMVLIRFFETKAIEHYRERLNRGPLHAYVGEEANAVGACMALRKGDYITSTHRGHGHCIAMGGDVNRMLAEIVGKETGYCRGKGGSMHIADLDLGIIGANGIVGAGIPIAVGAAIALDNGGKHNVILCFFGDGASNTGAFHESLNMASIWKLPVVFFCENNCYAISTCTKDSLNIEDISVRSGSYGIPGETVDGNDVLQVYAAVKKARSRAVEGGGPTLVESKTYRTVGHWIGDPIRYRTKEEEASWRVKCPVSSFRKHLIREGIMSEQQVLDLEEEVRVQIENAEKFALDSPDPDPEEALEDIYV